MFDQILHKVLQMNGNKAIKKCSLVIGEMQIKSMRYHTFIAKAK